MVMAPKVFITGATGYIGGDALYHLVESHPDYDIVCLVRDSEKGSQVASQYSNVRLVYGTLDSHDLLEEQAKKADIVLSRLLPHMYKVSGADELWLPDCANADHEGAVKAILRGLSSHSAPQPGYLVHTSGTGTLCWADLERETFGEAANKTYDDWDGVQELTSLPDKAPHRNVDKVILAEGTENADVLRTAIVCPPCIYGKGRGPGNQRSIQMPDLAKCILQGKKGFQVGSGRTLWNNVHVNDLSDCFLKLIEAAVAGGGKATWGKEGYYLTENGTLIWGDMSKVVSVEAHKQGLIPTDEIVSLSIEEVNRLRSHGSLLWGANSRGTAIRARKLLGWSPRGKSIEAETPQLVQEEARNLGLTTGHAAQVAG